MGAFYRDKKWRMAAKGKRSRPGSHLDPQAMCFRPGSGEVQGTRLKEGPGTHRVRRGPNRWLYSGSPRTLPRRHQYADP